MVVAFRDVSERRRLEKMKDEFISTVSHELRTPLTSLRASLGLVASGSLDKRPEKQRQMLEMAIGELRPADPAGERHSRLRPRGEGAAAVASRAGGCR